MSDEDFHFQKRVLFGASVHPLRKDWKDELDYCSSKGTAEQLIGRTGLKKFEQNF